MWPLRRPPETPHEPESSPKRGLNVFTKEHARSEWNYGRFSRLLKVLAVAHMAAYPVLDEIGIVASNVPRAVEKAVGGKDSEKQAKELLERYKKEIESGEPVPIDLATFYLEQEREAAGVSQKDADAARKKFEEILAKAMKMKERGAHRAEVLGFVLKQQGAYDDASSLMTDLLVRGKGECEARQRFISSAYQRLYPQDVQAGKMKSETFRSWVDKHGVYHAGHVRVVIDQGARVEVLEGDALQVDPKSEHEKITKTETTRLAVTGYAAKEGLYDLNEDSRVKPVSVEEQAKRVLSGSHALESAKQALHDAVADNSVSAYPDSATTYGVEGVGTRDVDPKPVAGSYTPSHYDWDKAVEITLTKPHEELTMKNFEHAYNRQSGYFDLRDFEIKDPAVMRSVVELWIDKRSQPPERERHPFYIRPDQSLPVEPFEKTPGVFFIDNASVIPASLERIPVSALSLYSVKTIPKNIGRVNWLTNGDLFVMTSGEGDVDPDYALRSLGKRLYEGKVTVRREDPMISVVLGKDAQKGSPLLGAGAFDGLEVDSLVVDGVNVASFGVVDAKEIHYQGEMHPGQFSEVTARSLNLLFQGKRPVGNWPLYQDDFEAGSNAADIQILKVTGRGYEDNAFRHASFDVLMSAGGGPLRPDVFHYALIGRLVLIDEPLSVFAHQVTQLGSWMDAPEPYLGEGIGAVSFIIAEEPSKYDERMKNNYPPGPTLREQVSLARSSKCVDSSIPIFILSMHQQSSLEKRYGGFDKIPMSALVAADYLGGEFAR